MEVSNRAFCSNCGQQLDDKAKFCSACGTSRSVQQTANENERRTVYEGEIHKCPNCGDIIDAYETVCETCGYEIRDRKTTSVVHELALKLENIDNIKNREELIRNFYIPNTKEDIYEFFILAFSNIESGGEETDAWLSKLEQAYQKVRLLFGSSSDFSYFQDLYDKIHKQKSKRKLVKFVSKWWMCLLGAIVTIVGLYLEIMGNFKGAESGDPDSPYYMLALLAFMIMGGGAALFGLGIKYGISHSKHNK